MNRGAFYPFPATMNGFWLLPVVAYGIVLIKDCASWTYHTSGKNMTYADARNWCKENNFTDLLTIQNNMEIQYLNKTLKRNGGHYWIGLRKIDGEWKWVGTHKTLTKEAENWAKGEPNNKREDEDCVEMYIQRETDPGKWNDERCDKEKVALCYKVSCMSDYCNGRGECLETINGYTCRCGTGFEGPDCEHVVVCGPPQKAAHGSLKCSNPSGHHAWNSTCEFACQEGFRLKGPSTLQCGASGEWDEQEPECEAIKCEAPQQPQGGFVKCSHINTELTYNSACDFSCEEGYSLKGSSRIQCSSKGQWSEPIPVCEVVECSEPKPPVHGSLFCSPASGKFAWNSSCEFTCQEGFALKGSAKLQCGPSGEWGGELPKCEAVKCEAIPQPKGGFVTCSRAVVELIYNSTCHFGCEEGYSLRGSTQIQCSSQGQWSTPIPVCEAAQCEILTVPENGFLNCSNPDGQLVYSTICEVSCMEGWRLNGSHILQCQASGNWTAKLPTCEAPRTPWHSVRNFVVGAAVGASLAVGSLVTWLIKRFRRKVKAFVPARI